MKKGGDIIYEPNAVPKGVVGPLHGLCMQLLANGLIELAVDNSHAKHSGNDSLLFKYVIVRPGKPCRDGLPGYHDLERWNGMNYIEEAIAPLPPAQASTISRSGRGGGGRGRGRGRGNEGRGRGRQSSRANKWGTRHSLIGLGT